MIYSNKVSIFYKTNRKTFIPDLLLVVTILKKYINERKKNIKNLFSKKYNTVMFCNIGVNKGE